MTHTPSTKETAALNAVAIAREIVPEDEIDAPRKRAHLGACAYYYAREFENLVVAYNARRIGWSRLSRL